MADVVQKASQKSQTQTLTGISQWGLVAEMRTVLICCFLCFKVEIGRGQPLPQQWSSYQKAMVSWRITARN